MGDFHKLTVADLQMASWARPLTTAQPFLGPYTQDKEPSVGLPNSEPIYWESQMEMALKNDNELKH